MNKEEFIEQYINELEPQESQNDDQSDINKEINESFSDDLTIIDNNIKQQKDQKRRKYKIFSQKVKEDCLKEVIIYFNNFQLILA